MKRINFSEGGKTPHTPFWMPWGAGGCLWRGLAFLALIGLLILLVSLFRSCGDDDRTASLPEEFQTPLEPGQPLVPIDTVGGQDGNIPDPGPDLPGPGDNFLPPFDDDQLIDNPDDGRQYVGNLLNVMLDSEANDDTFRRWAAEFKQNYPGDEYTIKFYDSLTKLLQIQVPAQEAQAVMQQLPEKISDIEFLVFPEGLMGAWGKRPNDPVFKYPQLCWYFAPIQAYDAWDVTFGSPDITVAIVDTFFDLNHDDLNSNRIVKPYSILKRNGNVLPDPAADPAIRNHGTEVAALAVGNGGNGRGSTGIAPKCRLMPVSMGNHLTSMTMLEGLLYSIYQGADVVNISAGAQFSPLIAQLPVNQQINLSRQMMRAEQIVWQYAFDIADKRNVTIVWAAGNSNIFTALDPSKRGQNTVKVSATGPDGHKAVFSDFGNFPQWGINESTVSAPGVSIFGAVPFNSYAQQDGTSFSAPITAGAIALMKSVNPNLTNEQVIEILKSTGRPVPGGNTIGPLLQIRSALDRCRR